MSQIRLLLTTVRVYKLYLLKINQNVVGATDVGDVPRSNVTDAVAGQIQRLQLHVL